MKQKQNKAEVTIYKSPLHFTNLDAPEDKVIKFDEMITHGRYSIDRPLGHSPFLKVLQGLQNLDPKLKVHVLFVIKPSGRPSEENTYMHIQINSGSDTVKLLPENHSISFRMARYLCNSIDDWTKSFQKHIDSADTKETEQA